MQTAYGNCIIYIENVDADIRDNPTVCVVLLAPREPVQFIFSFLLHNKPVLIGSK